MPRRHDSITRLVAAEPARSRSGPSQRFRAEAVDEEDIDVLFTNSEWRRLLRLSESRGVSVEDLVGSMLAEHLAGRAALPAPARRPGASSRGRAATRVALVRAP
jgi:hypothetical protein